MKNSMIKHFLSLHKNRGKLTKKTLNENEVVLCDGFFFFIQDRKKMVLNENIFVELKKDIFTEMIEKREYEECKIACYLPTWRIYKANKEKIASNSRYMQITNIENGQVIEFESLKETASFLGKATSTIIYHVERKSLVCGWKVEYLD